MKLRTNLLIVVFFLMFFDVNAQQKKMFSVDEFIEQVRKNHPVARRAAISVDKAVAELMSARGKFDPFVDADASHKTFDGKNYYDYFNPELVVPTARAFKLKSGLERNRGEFISTELTSGRSSYVGLEVPLGKGLLIDPARANLQQARIGVTQSEQERTLKLNDLLYNAYAIYWEWAGAFQLYNVYTRFIDIANDRLRLTRIAVGNGDRPRMDSIEAYTQVQNYMFQQSQALIALNEASLELGNYLWTRENVAYQLPDNFVPDTTAFNTSFSAQSLEEVTSASLNQNPVFRVYQSKLRALEVERRLKFQGLLPTFNVTGNILNRDYNPLKDVNRQFLENNYKWGLTIRVPLTFREARGDYRKAQLDIRDMNIDLENKRVVIENKIRTYFNERNFLLQQTNVINGLLNNYQLLLRNEELKMTQGESSLFLINTREIKVVETIGKQVELRIKYLKSSYAIEWAAGLLR